MTSKRLKEITFNRGTMDEQSATYYSRNGGIGLAVSLIPFVEDRLVREAAAALGRTETDIRLQLKKGVEWRAPSGRRGRNCKSYKI